MASRYTEKALKADIQEINMFLMDSGSVYFYELGQGAYGDTAVCRRHITNQGIVRAGVTTVEIGTPKECYNTMYQEYDHYLGKVYHTEKKSSRTRKTAKAILSPFINFTRDSVQLRPSQLVLLAKWAKWTNYRKPQGACFSLGTAFYIHLQKKVKI